MNSPKNWDLQVDPDVFKTLRKISRRDAETVLAAVKLLPSNPYFGDIQKIRGEENTWRRRIGSYRISYKIKIQESIILVFRLERRTSKSY